MYQLTDKPIDSKALRQAVTRPEYGAILVFLGVARDNFKGRPVTSLAYEAYPDMAIPVLKAIGDEIAEKWPGTSTAIAHRTGSVPISEASVVIATGTAHREACYEANRYAIEQLKARVPIWKKEIYDDGSAWIPNLKG